MKFTILIIFVLVAALLFSSLSQAQAQMTPCGPTYTVKSGDLLDRIAEQCGVTYSALVEANPQVDTPNLIYPGQILNIPIAADSDNQPVTVPVTGGSIYIVQPGDTLATIANRFGVTVDEMVAANPLLKQQDQFYSGMRLTLPQGAARVTTLRITPTSGKVGTPVTLSATGFQAGKEVVIGFGALGATYYQLDKTITDANGAVYRQYLIPDWPIVDGKSGQFVFYVALTENSGIHAISNPISLSHDAGLPLPPDNGGRLYVVQQGDTLSEIALRYHTTLQQLLALNPAIGNPQLIYTGQTILVPGETIPSVPVVFLSTTDAKAGETIRVSARNFPGNAIVDVRIAQQGKPFSNVVDARADEGGQVNAVIVVPQWAQAGEQWTVLVTTTERVDVTKANSQWLTIVP